MRLSSSLVILILASAVVFTAGCTQGTSPALPATPIPVITPDLPDLAITSADLPACFSLTEHQVKSSADVGELAKDLGWRAGYGVTYTCPSEGPEPTVLLHSLAAYPAANMPGIATMVDNQDRPAGYLYEDLTFPDRGITMRGFYLKAGSVQVSGASTGANLLTGRSKSAQTDTVAGSSVAEIIFYRGTTFEVLRMTGPGTNATLLEDLALKASAKIP
ncbi:MAG: hypothetical protein WC379_13090 [Methanoregula sp.]|jgi:hypothetical protein